MVVSTPAANVAVACCALCLATTSLAASLSASLLSLSHSSLRLVLATRLTLLLNFVSDLEEMVMIRMLQIELALR